MLKLLWYNYNIWYNKPNTNYAYGAENPA